MINIQTNRKFLECNCFNVLIIKYEFKSVMETILNMIYAYLTLN